MMDFECKQTRIRKGSNKIQTILFLSQKYNLIYKIFPISRTWSIKNTSWSGVSYLERNKQTHVDSIFCKFLENFSGDLILDLQS